MAIPRPTVNDYYFSPHFGWDTLSAEISDELGGIREMIKSIPINRRSRRYVGASSEFRIIIKLDQAGIITGEYLVENNGRNFFFEIRRGASSPVEPGVFGPADAPEFAYT